MNPFSLPRTYREALGCFELFRLMGYAADYIFFQFSEIADGECLMQVCLLAPDVNFIIDAGRLRGRKDALEKQWVDLAEAVSEGRVTQNDLGKVWSQSFARKQYSEIAVAVMAKASKNQKS